MQYKEEQTSLRGRAGEQKETNESGKEGKEEKFHRIAFEMMSRFVDVPEGREKRTRMKARSNSKSDTKKQRKQNRIEES